MLQFSDLFIAGRYRLLHRLHRGGMSEVFLAFDEQTQQHVAVKLVTSDDTESMKRLQHEVSLLRNLSHPHILPMLDDGIAGSYHYLVLPYMQRGNLRERLVQGPVTQEEAGDILAQLAEALQYAHQRGIVHRDIKPSNVLLDNTDTIHVYLADFGLAKVTGEGSDITQTGDLIGTPQYMAPELATMPESVSSDIYALGIVLYEMLTGRLPFTGRAPLAIYWKHMQEQPAPPSTLNVHISPVVEQVILRALDKDPQRRFPGAQAMSLAYSHALKWSDYPSALPALNMPMLPPVQVTLRKRETRPGAAFVRGLRRNPTGKAIQRASLCLAALLLMALPLSLGFLLSGNDAHVNPLLGSSTVFEKAVVSTPSPAPPAHHNAAGAAQVPGSTAHHNAAGAAQVPGSIGQPVLPQYASMPGPKHEPPHQKGPRVPHGGHSGHKHGPPHHSAPPAAGAAQVPGSIRQPVLPQYASMPGPKHEPPHQKGPRKHS